MITINWQTKVISVLKSDLTLIQSTPAEIRELDINWFRMQLKDLEDSEAGMPYPDTHTHNTEIELGGTTYARFFEIINGYTVAFEDGQYAVNLVGANSNIADVTNVNQVSIRSSNSAGLIVYTENGNTFTLQDIRDAMKLSPSAGESEEGSIDKRLIDIEQSIGNIPGGNSGDCNAIVDRLTGIEQSIKDLSELSCIQANENGYIINQGNTVNQGCGEQPLSISSWKSTYNFFDSSNNASQQVKFYDGNPELQLFNELDRAYISMSAPPCLVRLLMKQDAIGYDEDEFENIYSEIPVKTFDSPIEIHASFAPEIDIFQLTFFNGDFPKECHIWINVSEWEEKMRREAQAGDLILTPECNFIYRITDVQKTDPVFFGKNMHYSISGALEEELHIENFDNNQPISF